MPGREMLKNRKTIEMDGLLWDASKLVPIGYGIKKLQLMAVVEDDQDKLCEFEDFIQSMDIAALNMI
jgi:translation elongation factor EF-1beta